MFPQEELPCAEIIIFYLFSIILAKRFGLRTLACATVTYNPLCRERKLATAASRQLVAGFEGLFQRKKKNTQRDALGVLFSGVRYGIRTHGLQGHNLTR